MLTWELIGAVVGAGLASGREIASFFSKSGGWSWAGIVMAVLTMVFLGDVRIPVSWQGRWPARLWRKMTALLLTATGGAMLSGAGEIASLTLPAGGAYWLGLGLTLVLSWVLAHRTPGGLAAVSRALLCVLAALILLGFAIRPMQAVPLSSGGALAGLLRAVSYGGFNAALQMPLMMASSCGGQKRRRAIWLADGIILLLLLMGNAVLLRHPALLGEPMPFIRMLQSFGKPGYYLGALSLYLAILSTLTACLRGLGGGVLPLGGVFLAALLGFTGVVERAYPILGGGCLMMLAAAKFTNSSGKAFISRRSML